MRDWPGLRTVVAVESIRSINGSGKVEAEIRYFLSSCIDAPEMLAKAIRQHWAIENSLHWVLDVTFREDDCRVRDRTAVRNFALLRKIAINLVRRHNSSRNSLRGRRKIAAWNNQYMRQVLTGIFHAEPLFGCFEEILVSHRSRRSINSCGGLIHVSALVSR